MQAALRDFQERRGFQERQDFQGDRDFLVCQAFLAGRDFLAFQVIRVTILVLVASQDSVAFQGIQVTTRDQADFLAKAGFQESLGSAGSRDIQG
ncbi:MAG: hypothetical protein EBT27_10060 [Betaproteobacteria bacterium]|nr:hypothetical protein [Betaproteobacteria bacterium]